MDKKSTSASGDEPAQNSTILPVDGNPAPAESATSNPEPAADNSEPAASATVSAAIPEPFAPTELSPAAPAATEPAPIAAAQAAPAPKKPKTGLIVGIIIAVLLALGGLVFAIWYFAFYQNPENVVFDAMNKFLAAEHVSPHGALKTTIETDDYNFSLMVTTESSASRLPNESEIWLMLGVLDKSNDAIGDLLKVQIGTVQMSDGVVYLKLDHLSDTLDILLGEVIPGTVCADDPDPECSELPAEIEEAAYAIADLLDDEWWRISLPELLDEVDDIESWQADAITDIYTCALDAMSADSGAELASLYRQNNFLKVKKDAHPAASVAGASAYAVSLDHYALSNFINSTKELDAATDFYSCYNAVIDRVAKRYAREYSYYDEDDFEDYKLSADSFDDVSGYDLKKIFPEDAKIILHIDNWGHALREVELEFEVKDQPVSLSFGFAYESAEVSVPADYRPITELFEEITDIVSELYDFDPDDYDYDYDFSCDADDPGLCFNDIDYSAFDFYGV